MRFLSRVPVAMVLLVCACATAPERMRSALDKGMVEEAIRLGNEYIASNDTEHRPSVHALLEKAHWEQSIKAGTIVAYEKYLSLHPQGAHSDTATRLLGDLTYQTVTTKRDDLDAYSAFLSRFPLSPYAQAARERKLDLAWKVATATGNCEGYQHFRRTNPNSPYEEESLESEAQIALEELRDTADADALLQLAGKYSNTTAGNTARHRADVQAWDDATNRNTALAWRRYIDRFPRGRVAAAQARLASFPWLEQLRGVFPGQDLSELVLVCNTAGMAVVDPKSGRRHRLSQIPTARCESSLQGEFITFISPAGKAPDSRELWTLFILDLRSSRQALKVSPPFQYRFCIPDMRNGLCTLFPDAFPTSVLERTPGGGRTSTLGVAEAFEVGMEGEEDMTRWMLDWGSKSLDFRHLDKVKALHSRLQTNPIGPNRAIQDIGHVAIPRWEEEGLEFGGDRCEVSRSPGGLHFVSVLQACNGWAFAFYDPKSRRVLSVSDRRRGKRAPDSTIETASVILISPSEETYIANGCVYNTKTGKKFCDTGMLRFLGLELAVGGWSLYW